MIIPGFIIIDARGEGACQGDRTSIFKFSCVLAEVPNVALSVLRIPIEGIFRQHAIEINHIVNFGTGDTHDHFGFVGDDEIVVYEAILGLPFINKGLTGWQRKERIGHVSHEIGRIDYRIISGGTKFLAGSLARRIPVLAGLERVVKICRGLFSTIGSCGGIRNVGAFAQRN